VEILSIIYTSINFLQWHPSSHRHIRKTCNARFVMNFFKWFMRKFQEISTARGRIKGLTITAELKRLFHEISILWHFSFFRENLYYFRTEHYEQNNSYSRFLELQKNSREGMTSAIQY